MGATVLLSYAAAGGLLALIFYRAQRMRHSGWAQGVAIAISVGGGAATLAALGRSIQPGPELTSSHLGQGYLFLCASMCHAPTIVYILLFQWNRLLEELTSPGKKELPAPKERTERDEWRAVEQYLQALARRPVDPVARRQLADCYRRLDLIESAVSEYLRTIECLDRGYEHGGLMFKVARLLVDQIGDTRRALPLLRRLIRLYPKSWFAAYSRRIINQYEAHVSEA